MQKEVRLITINRRAFAPQFAGTAWSGIGCRNLIVMRNGFDPGRLFFDLSPGGIPGGIENCHLHCRPGNFRPNQDSFRFGRFWDRIIFIRTGLPGKNMHIHVRMICRFVQPRRRGAGGCGY